MQHDDIKDTFYSEPIQLNIKDPLKGLIVLLDSLSFNIDNFDSEYQKQSLYILQDIIFDIINEAEEIRKDIAQLKIKN